MSAKKLEFTHDVMHLINEICAVAFNIKSDEQLEKVFGINKAQMEAVVWKIISGLPDYIFERIYPRLLDEIKNICALEFIFFQVQEKWNDPRYQEDLSNFICIFSRDIQHRIDEYKERSSSS